VILDTAFVIDVMNDDVGATEAYREFEAAGQQQYLASVTVLELYEGIARAVDSATERERFASNAHVKRRTFDAAVLVRGTAASRLFNRAVPLSTPAAGADANRLVTTLSNDSGRGPWWRRVLRYDGDATVDLRGYLDRDPAGWLGAGGADTASE
jgi:predicted nucleic acid-binding protein